MKGKGPMGWKLLFLIIGCIFIFAPSVLAYDLGEYFPLGQQDTWKYKVTKDEAASEYVLKIDGKEMIGNTETAKMFIFAENYQGIAIDSEGVKEYKNADSNEYELFNPPKIMFPQMEVGQAKSYSVNFTIYSTAGENLGEGSEEGHVTLESIESVEVPAGKFDDCLKFILSSDWKLAGGNSEKKNYTIWLAPNIGKVKESFFSVEYDAATKEEEISIEVRELISAVIGGKNIGIQ